MKAVLMSIKPKWCEKIFNGEKTVEVRKTAPKLKPPYKVYMYCTKEKEPLLEVIKDGDDLYGEIYHGEIIFVKGYRPKGKVVGEFVCDEKHDIQFTGASYMINNDISLTNGIAKQSCLWFDDMLSYLGVKGGAALHITAPKRYDTPKELSEFWTVRCTNKTGECKTCEVKPTRPPQSWMYVEELC